LQRSLRSLDPALPLAIRTWDTELDSALFASRVATVALGVLWTAGYDARHHRNLRHGVLYGEQANSVIRYPHRARREST
jgi:hypothetical protein